MVRGTQIPLDLTLVRTIAVAARPLEEDINLSPLQAIDQLLTLRDKFQSLWVRGAPWLVLEDYWTIPASMPIPKMLEDMSEHGKPVGIVGGAQIDSGRRDVVFKRFFRKDKKSREPVEVSAQAVENDFQALRKAVISAEVFLDPSGDTASMYYSFDADHTPEPGSRKVGSIVYTVGGKIESYITDEHFANAMEQSVMEQSLERFNKTVKKLQEIQREEMNKKD